MCEHVSDNGKEIAKNVTCRYFLIPEHGSRIVITHEIFHYYFLLLTLPKGASNKILKTNIVMERYLCF